MDRYEYCPAFLYSPNEFLHQLLAPEEQLSIVLLECIQSLVRTASSKLFQFECSFDLGEKTRNLFSGESLVDVTARDGNFSAYIFNMPDSDIRLGQTHLPF